jgi:hypothetical protein
LFKLGVYLATKPPETTTVVVTGTTYYYSGGVFLVTSGTGYVVASAPPGAVIYAVPVGTTVVHVGSTPYYYYGGTFYVVSSTSAQAPPPAPAATAPAATTTAVASTAKEQSLGDVEMIEDDQSYEVVTPPVGATVPYLPEEASEATVGGKKYFVHNDTYYRPFASDGETIYMIVDDPRKSPA